MNPTSRRHFLATSAAVAAAVSLPRLAAAQAKEPLFKISLAQWSLHKAMKAGELANRDFAKTAKQDYGIDGIEYVNQLWTDLGKDWMESAKDKAYVAELKKRNDDLGVKSLLIMCDNPGQLGDSDEAKRTTAIEGHYRWVEAAKSSAAIRSASMPAPTQKSPRKNSKNSSLTASAGCLNLPRSMASMSLSKTTADYRATAIG